MADIGTGKKDNSLHYENGIPVFSPIAQDEKTELRAERKAQRTLEERQVGIQGRMLWTQIILVVFGLIGAGINIYQAQVSKINANASLLSAQAAQSAAQTANSNLLETQKQSESSTEQFKIQLGRLDASLNQAGILADAAKRQAIATHEFAIQAQRSADYAKQAIDTAVFAERPWIGVTAFSVESHIEGQTAKAHFSFSNTGKRPATARVRVLRVEYANLPPYPFAGMNSVASVAFILPGGIDSSVLSYEVPKDMLSKLKKEHKFEFFLAEITYSDVETGKAYITHYCAGFDPASTDLPFPLCTRYNEAK